MKQLLLVPALMTGLQTLASTSPQPMDWIYSETLAQCQGSSQSQLGSIVNKNTLHAAIISVGQSLSFVLPLMSSDPREQMDYLSNRFISDYTMDRLNSPGYLTAVNECFPGRADLQRNFTLAMMAADSLGKAPAIVFSLYTFQVSKGVFSAIKTKYPALYSTLRGVSGVGFVALVLYEARQTYLGYQLTEKEKESVAKFNDGLTQITKQEREAINSLALETIRKISEKISSETNPQKKDELIAIREKLRAAYNELNKVSNP